MITKPLYWFNLETGETILASVYEEYIGLRGQQRIGLVDDCGRVHHFDRRDMTIIGIPGVKMCANG